MYHTAAAAALTNKHTYNMCVKQITIINTILKHELRKSDSAKHSKTTGETKSEMS